MFGMDRMPKKLLCDWHVKTAWQNKLSLFKDKEKRQHVWGALESLYRQKSQDSFQEAMNELLQRFTTDPELCALCEYFWGTYRAEQWAACCRTTSELSTNMKIESFHRVLK